MFERLKLVLFGEPMLMEDTEPIGRDLPAINLMDLTACMDCGNVYYLEIAEECPVCGSEDNLSPLRASSEGEKQ